MHATPRHSRAFPFGVSLLLAMLTLWLSGCETTRRLSPAATTPEASQAAAARKHQVELTLINPDFSSELTALPTFRLAVQNRGSERLDFGPSHIRVFSGDQPVLSYTRDQLSILIQETIRQEAEAYTGQQAEVFLQADASRVDPSAAMANIEAAKRTNRAGKAASSYEAVQAEAAQLLAPTTIAPEGSLRALLKFQAGSITAGQPLRVLISLDGEIYEFRFNAT